MTVDGHMTGEVEPTSEVPDEVKPMLGKYDVRSSAKLEWRILAEDADAYETEITIVHYKINGLFHGHEISLICEKGEMRKEKWPEQVNDPLLHQLFQSFQRSTSGSIKGKISRKKRVKQPAPTGAPIVSPDAWPQLPMEPVAVGQTWIEEAPGGAFLFSSGQETAITNKFDRVDTRDGTQVAVITTSGLTRMPEGSAERERTALFAIDAGYFVMVSDIMKLSVHSTFKDPKPFSARAHTEIKQAMEIRKK